MPESMRNLAEENALHELKQTELAIIYKHSPICPVSWKAQREVNRFIEQNPDIPIYFVNVVQDRTLSRRLADELGIRHESPQTILLRSGGASKHASHHQITAQLLESWVCEASE